MAVIKFRVWTGGNYPGLVGGTNAITGVVESQRYERGSRSQGQGETGRCCADDFGDGARGHKLRNAGAFQKMGNMKKRILP